MTIQELDKHCEQIHIEKLIELTEQKEKIEGQIQALKKTIAKYTKENGVIYSDSKHTISLVYTPKVEWKDEFVQRCDKSIAEYNEEIKLLENDRKIHQESRSNRIQELQAQIKETCESQNKSVSEVWDNYSKVVKFVSDSYHIRIDKTSKKTDHDRTWIFRKE